jgi:signal transduction histidine kinase
VLRSLSSWAEESRRHLWLLGLAVGVLGVAAESSLYGWGDPGDWLPDLITGWTLASCGLIAHARRPESKCGLLLVAAGIAWFLPDLATVGAGWLRWLAAHLLYLYRGPLVALVLTYPRGQPRGRLEVTAVVTGFGISLVVSVWESAAMTIGVAAGMICVAVVVYLQAAGHERAMRRYAVVATAYLASVLVATAVVRAASTNGAASTLHAFEAALCVLALASLAGLVTAPWSRRDVTDLVVEIGEGESGTLRDELAAALGDPSLRVGYWLAHVGRFIDATGAPFDVPSAEAEHATTTLEVDGEPVAILVHDPVVLDDPGLLDAIRTAARLGSANARLQAEVKGQLGEITASRRRILEAEDTARGRLERSVRAGALARLDQLSASLEAARSSAISAVAVDRIVRAQAILAHTSEELQRLARGIRPEELGEDGVAPALERLASEFPLPVQTMLSPFKAPASVSACVYFVCSEALANVAKYGVLPGSRSRSARIAAP